MSAETVPKRGRPKNIEASIQRKDDILSSASLLFATNGYAETKVDTVAEELDISKGTIYRYFNSKRELFVAAVDREMQRLIDTVTEDEVSFDNPIDQVSHATTAYLRFFKDNPHAVELITQERAAFPELNPRFQTADENPMLGPIRKSIRGLMDGGYYRKLPLDDLMEMFSNLLYGTIMSSTLQRDDLDLPGLTRNMLDVLLVGVTTEKAREEWGLKRD
ncbi:MAG TPA: TetR/AcrR family transcriptional regulator [Candidatus Hydrogenedentes bacterium]|nr:TetR/AcrR family transcriptional regulator [Candidatus Hydrogenedentota bacterium]